MTELLVFLGPASLELPSICICSSSFPSRFVFTRLCLHINALEKVVIFVHFAGVVAFSF